MLKKKITSLILALSMTIASTASFSAYAFRYIYDNENYDPFIEELGDNWVRVDNWNGFIFTPQGDNSYAMYMYKSNFYDDIYHETTFYCIGCSDRIKITIPPDDDSTKEKIIAKAESLGENIVYSGYSTFDSKKQLYFKHTDSDGCGMPITSKEATVLYELIKDDVDGYEYTSYKFGWTKGASFNMTTYGLYPIKSMGIEVKDILDFIDSEKIEYEIYINEWDLEIIPINNISSEEHLQIARKIYDKFGLGINVGYEESGGSSFNIGGTVDMKNAVKGDANDDSEVSIADATAILQAIGNPDKYKLSAQGEYNADVYGDHDGITPMDALTIQQYDAHIIDSF